MIITLNHWQGKNDVKVDMIPLNKNHRYIKPLKDIPKSWKKIGLSGYSLNNNYNQSLMEIYTAKDNTLRFSVYRDGCFFQYCGKLVII
jgi:hypothetical protein